MQIHFWYNITKLMKEQKSWYNRQNRIHHAITFKYCSFPTFTSYSVWVSVLPPAPVYLFNISEQLRELKLHFFFFFVCIYGLYLFPDVHDKTKLVDLLLKETMKWNKVTVTYKLFAWSKGHRSKQIFYHNS